MTWFAPFLDDLDLEPKPRRKLSRFRLVPAKRVGIWTDEKFEQAAQVSSKESAQREGVAS